MLKDTFGAVPISMSFVSEIKALFPTGSVNWNRTINDEDRVIYVIFFM